MGKAKDIVLRPISAQEANALVRRVHYSGKVVNNSQIHIGVFYRGELEGAMQFGPSLDKRKIMGLVEGTKWNEFIELNRLAFTDNLPRNSESRAISIAMRLLRQYAPQLKWVVSFADGTLCGDGTIYRASGFVLTGIIRNHSLWQFPDGTVKQDTAIKPGISSIKWASITHGASSVSAFKDFGASILDGYNLRYVYFLDPAYRARLTVPEIPYDEIWKRGAGMYRGERCDERRAGEAMLVNAQGDQP